MRYRIPLPLHTSTKGRQLDIIDPAWSTETRALAQHGLGDVEAATNAVLLALFDECCGERSFIDAGAGIGVSSVLCAHLFPRTHIVAIEPRERPASMLRRIAAANELDVDVRTELSDALEEVAASGCLVVRVGTTVDAVEALKTIATASGVVTPHVVIVGDRDRAALLSSAKAAGYVVYPLRRFPSWRPLQDDADTALADGWLLTTGVIPDALRERHTIWAGALGACTPDRNDRQPFMVELRSGFRDRRGGTSLLARTQRDLARGARAIWHRIDPWLPPPTSRPGRLISQVVVRARQLLPLQQGR